MNLDPEDYATGIAVQLTHEKWIEFCEWAEENNTTIKFSYGNVYFKDEAIAILFRLKFGL